MWKYESPIGSLYIKALENKRYGLFYNEILIESSDSPQAEADNVYMHCTGLWEWDSLDGTVFDVPNDLSEWERI